MTGDLKAVLLNRKSLSGGSSLLLRCKIPSMVGFVDHESTPLQKSHTGRYHKVRYNRFSLIVFSSLFECSIDSRLNRSIHCGASKQIAEISILSAASNSISLVSAAVLSGAGPFSLNALHPICAPAVYLHCQLVPPDFGLRVFPPSTPPAYLASICSRIIADECQYRG